MPKHMQTQVLSFMLAALRDRTAVKDVQLHEGGMYPARLLAGDSAGGM